MKNLHTRYPGPDQELASDLEWLLNSHQFPAGQVAEGLVQACFLDLYHWMILCLCDQELAAAAALKTILTAAENAYRYSGEPSPQVWVFRQGVEEIRRTWRQRFWRSIWASLKPKSADKPGLQSAVVREATLWRAVDRLPVDQRLLFNLVYGLGWSLEQAALVLALPGKQAADLSQQAVQATVSTLEVAQGENEPLSPDELDEWLTTGLRRRLDRFAGDPIDLDELARLAGGELDRQDRRRGRASSWQENLWLVGMAGVIALVIWSSNLWLPEPDNQPVAATATRASQNTVPDNASSITPEPTPSGQIAVYQVQPGDSLGSVAAFFSAPLDEIRRLNPETKGGELSPGQTLKVVLRSPERAVFPTPVMPETHLSTPLDYWMTPKELIDWLIITPARWVTVWLDGTISDYGPPGIIRAPERTRFQGWFSKPDQALIITQSADHNLSRTLTLGDWQYASDPDGKIEIRPADRRSNGVLAIHGLVSPVEYDFLKLPGSWRLQRVETQASRQAVVVDWWPDPGGSATEAGGRQAQSTHRRIWFDASLGVILRLQELVGDPGDETLVRELVVDSVQYDRVFPLPDQFSPWALNNQTFLSRDSGWFVNPVDSSPSLTRMPLGRQRLPKIPPGPGFDPSMAQLRFQYANSSPPDSQQVMADVFADSAYLGQIVISDPERMLCVRSRDGLQVAYTYDPFGNPDIMGIGWFRLEHPLHLQRVGIPLIPDSLAFSPNGRYLAYFASPLHASPGSLVVIDTQTGRQRQLAQLIYASSLVWGPDGKSLAMIVADPEPDQREVRILDVASGAITYRHKVSIASILNPDLRGPDWPAPDWPAHAWDTPFPAPGPSLQDCLLP